MRYLRNGRGRQGGERGPQHCDQGRRAKGERRRSVGFASTAPGKVSVRAQSWRLLGCPITALWREALGMGEQRTTKGRRERRTACGELPWSATAPPVVMGRGRGCAGRPRLDERDDVMRQVWQIEARVGDAVPRISIEGFNFNVGGAAQLCDPAGGDVRRFRRAAKDLGQPRSDDASSGVPTTVSADVREHGPNDAADDSPQRNGGHRSGETLSDVDL